MLDDTAMLAPEFKPWGKIAGLNRDMVITEKIDGTNACVVITEPDSGGPPFGVFAQSRKRIITPDDDNHGFARWVADHMAELVELGPGYHYGEWWGQGVQRGYGLDEKRFSLFNVGRWVEHDATVQSSKQTKAPECCHVVPVLDRYTFDQNRISSVLEQLRTGGSAAAPGYDNPEGVVVYHTHANQLFKATLDNDEQPKGQVNA